MEERNDVVASRAGRKVPMVSEGAEGRLREIVETQPAALVEVDAAGKILAINPRGRQAFGIGEDEAALGTPLMDRLPEPERDRFAMFVEQVCEGQPASHECAIGGASPRKISSEAVTLARGPDEAPAALIVATDVSRMRALEQQVRRLEQLHADREAALAAAEERARLVEAKHRAQAKRVEQVLARAKQQLGQRGPANESHAMLSVPAAGATS